MLYREFRRQADRGTEITHWCNNDGRVGPAGLLGLPAVSGHVTACPISWAGTGSTTTLPLPRSTPHRLVNFNPQPPISARTPLRLISSHLISLLHVDPLPAKHRHRPWSCATRLSGTAEQRGFPHVAACEPGPRDPPLFDYGTWNMERDGTRAKYSSS
jgi:hypothetical protein